VCCRSEGNAVSSAAVAFLLWSPASHWLPHRSPPAPAHPSYVMRAAYSSSTVAYSIWRPVLIPSGARGWSDIGAIDIPRMRLKPRPVLRCLRCAWLHRT
jgi:hypothetical protein